MAIADIVKGMGYPEALTVDAILMAPFEDTHENHFARMQLGDPNSRPKMKRWFELMGYVRVPNPNANNGTWFINGKRRTAYARADLTMEQRLVACDALMASRRVFSPGVLPPRPVIVPLLPGVDRPAVLAYILQCLREYETATQRQVVDGYQSVT